MKKKAINLSLVALFSVVTMSSYLPVGGKTEKSKTSRDRPVVARKSFDNIQFSFDKAIIPEEFETELKELITAIKEQGNAVKLSGHADSIGEYVYNWNLSKLRADKVKSYLVANGIDASRIASTEFGDTKPIATNATAAGRQKNRRVEIEIVE
jgi:outer membrane protein OmpA-like peptidoglycan-associated protein